MNIILTHDVDSIRRPFKHIWQRRKRFKIKDIILAALKIKNLYNNIEEIISLEDKYGYRSVFFVPVFLFDIGEIIDIIKYIKRQGWEVQLHYVYEANQYLGLFRMQKEFFEREIGPVKGVRVHGLILNDNILTLFQREKIKYDSTLRAETVNTYDPFFIRERLLEIPIGIMDTDIFGRLKLNEERALKYVLWKMKRAKLGGSKNFTILFHQESYNMRRGKIYREIVKNLSTLGFDVKLPDEYLVK